MKHTRIPEYSVDEESPALAALMADRLPGVTGHVVIVDGDDDAGEPAVAVWHLSPAGRPTGAWVRTVSSLDGDRDGADLLLRLTSHRALLAWDPAGATGVIGTLARLAGRPHAPRPRSVRLPDVLREIAANRRAHQAAVAAHRSRTRSHPDPLVWRHDIPAARSWEEFVIATRLHEPHAAAPVAARALHLARAAAWVAARWRETERARRPRGHLAVRFGPPALLPPGWRAQLRAAHAAGRRC